MRFIWATRGRTWGFRFLRDGGYRDPLPVYDAAFAEVEGEREVCRRVGGAVALRFPDPEGRRDAAGRFISHDFVVFEAGAAVGPGPEEIGSVEDGRRVVWPLVAEEFARVWALPEPPARG